MSGPTRDPDDTSTESLRRERGEPDGHDPRDRLADARIGPSSIGVVGKSPSPEREEEIAERQTPPAADATGDDREPGR